MNRVLLLCAAAGLASGCAAGQAKPRDVDELRRQLDSLRRQSERDQRAIKSLESRVFICEDRLETAQVARARTTDAPPRLPVTRKSPRPPPAPPVDERDDLDMPIPSPDPIEEPYDSDDVEIVYEGEAARDMRPRRVIRIHESSPTGGAPYGSAGRGGGEGSQPPFDDDGEIDPYAVDEKIPVVPIPDAPTAAPAAPPAPPAPPPAPEKAALDPMSVYKLGYAALQQHDHATAVSSFMSFVQLWPAHDYADNAQYWLGEAYYDMKNYKGALAEFRKVVKRYPDGNKAPDALLKIGFCHAQLTDVDAARDVLAQVVEIYPKTDAAKLAAKRLEELKR